MLKRFMALVLLVAIVMAFVACGATEEQTPATVSTEAVRAEETTEEVTGEAEPETTEVAAPEMTFTEQVLVDDENCAVTVTGIEEDGLWGYTLKVLLENKTDLELMYAIDGVAVNGFMCDPFWAASVTAQMKANEEISFAAEAFERNGIEVPTEITFTLRVYDNNDWTADALVEQKFAIYPMGEEAVQPYERQAQPEEKVLFDNEQCSMIVTGFEMDEIWGYTMKVYLENKTDMDLMFSADGVAVNGFMCDPFWAETVVAGKRSNTEITWYQEALAENGITEVTEILLPMRVYDNNDWMADAVLEESFTINP